MSTDETLLKAGVVSSSLCALLTGVDASFNVYALSLRGTFNFTLTQVETVASTGTLGLGLAFVELFVTAKFGVYITFLVTWLLMAGSSGLLAMIAQHKHIQEKTPVLIYCAHFVFFLSTGVASMVSMRTNSELFWRRREGTPLRWFYSMYTLGKFVLATVFQLCYENNLAGFFCFLCVASLVLFGINYIVLVLLLNSSENHYSLIKRNEFRFKNTKQWTWKAIVKTKFFHYTFWPMVVSYAIMYAVLNNITIIAASVGERIPIITVYVICISGIVSRLIQDTVSAKFRSITADLLLMTASCVCAGVAIILLLLSWTGPTLYFSTVLMGFGIGPGMTTITSVLSRRFGQNYRTPICSAFCASVAVFQVGFQMILGYSYDTEAEIQRSRPIYRRSSQNSFSTTFTLMSVIIGLMSSVLLLNSCVYRFCQPKR